MHIPGLAAETIFHVGNFPVTNTMINAWVAILLFLAVGLYLRRRVSLRPGKVQNTLEYFLEIILGYFDQVTGDRKKTLRFLPLVGSVFFFILISNWLGILPGVGSITYGHLTLFRPANTDLNLTVAMAITAVLVSHIVGFFAIGFFSYINKFIQVKTLINGIKKGPMGFFTAFIEFFVGILEIISEFAKVLSLSLRLFGNIFAGEVLMSVMISLVAYIVPTPFMLLEFLVGLIQAGVFSILMLVYLTVATSAPHGEEEH